MTRASRAVGWAICLSAARLLCEDDGDADAALVIVGRHSSPDEKDGSSQKGGLRMLRATRFPSVVLLWVVLWNAGCQQSTTSSGPIAAEDLAKRIGSGSAPVVLDVRTPEEYAAGHIPGAINIPHDELAKRLAEIPGAKSTEIVVHCQAGGRAAKAENILIEEGYTDVRDLQGHFGGWVQEGLPVEPGRTP